MDTKNLLFVIFTIISYDGKEVTSGKSDKYKDSRLNLSCEVAHTECTSNVLQYFKTL